jgi:hypothetical protein
MSKSVARATSKQELVHPWNKRWEEYVTCFVERDGLHNYFSLSFTLLRICFASSNVHACIIVRF